MLKKPLTNLLQITLVLLVLTGAALRFYRTDWSQGTNLHPDEYGLTNTLTQLSLPHSLGEYFNTRLSPLSPYPKYDLAGQKVLDGPDNGMRWGQWPQTILRAAAELAGTTGYDELRLTGRRVSALADIFSLILLFAIGRRLYSPTVALLGTALSALAVLQIQQSHFMTVDNFAVLFSMLAMYTCVRIAQQPPLRRSMEAAPYRLNGSALAWYLLFGAALGMTLASKINLLPLAGMVLVAGFLSICDLKLRSRPDLVRIILAWGLLSAMAGLAALLAFRLAQPMSFRAPAGDTTFLTWRINPDWLENMKRAQSESSGIGGGPPAEQWAHRPVILFPLVNMVLWGLGLPLGVMSWAGFLWAAWRSLRYGENWRAHLLPLVWVGGYFLFMATRWVKSIRYFLPIYPFLALLAAWGILELWKWATHRQAGDASPSRARIALASGLAVLVVGGTLIWATAFVRAVYVTDNTRIRAVRWAFEHIPGPFHLVLATGQEGLAYQPVTAPGELILSSQRKFIRSFVARQSGRLASVVLPRASPRRGSAQVSIKIAADPAGENALDETIFEVKAGNDALVTGAFHQAELRAGETYYLVAQVAGDGFVTISRRTIAVESWDEGLPFPLDGIDPFGQLYNGVRMEVRWPDEEAKREMFITTLAQADYIVLSSQRGLWSTCRLARTYPMTMAYYRALFDGSLGFELAAAFSAPFQIGPLQVSDVGGTAAWGAAPRLPLFNHNLLAAEEAFSVYDHPPVWIFRKGSAYNQEAVVKFFQAIDLSQVVIESPRDASRPTCPGDLTVPGG